MSERFDAVIIGSGAGGGAAAFKLTQAGLRVCVVEKGPQYTAADFVHDEIATCRRNFWTPDPADDPHLVSKSGAPAVRSAEGFTASCVGGATVHMTGWFFRMQPDDFALRTRFGALAGSDVADWPFGLDALAPFYDEAERILGLSGDLAHAPPGRTAKFPTGPLVHHPGAAVVDEACAHLGLRSFVIPRAVISEERDGRAACMYCGFCGSYGCEAGAKSSSDVTFLARARRTGKLTLLPLTAAVRIETDKAGAAHKVIVRDASGQERALEGRCVIVACGAVESARLLLASESPQHPHGLANDSGLVGRNLMFAGFGGGWARFPTSLAPFRADNDSLPFIDRGVQDFYLAPSAGLPHPKAGTLVFARAHHNPIHRAERAAARTGLPPLFGAALQAKLREVFVDTSTLEWESFAEFFPHAGCKVSLDDTKDRWGHRAAHLDVALHPATQRALAHLRKEGEAIFAATKPASQGAYDDDQVYFPLQCGTARMGADPAASVLGADGQAHGVKNLYVTDGSGFPSSSGAPFTLTIMANALRIADGIAKRARTHTL